MTKTLQEEIYNSFLDWKKGNKEVRDHYDLFVQILVENQPEHEQKSYLTYWESLKTNYEKQNELMVNENIQGYKK